MSTIEYQKCSTTNLEPCKRVKYSQGLVLGVDEFQQEQHYFLERLRLHHRGLNGYGTVCGLDVSTRERGGVRELVVEPGWAVGPHGREIKVGTSQCANLDLWVASEVQEVGSPALVVRYLVLCHRECETDQVPIPGGPCRSPEESSAASRIQETFELKLTEEPPDQIEEDSVRALGEFLRQIVVDEQATSFTSTAELVELVRALKADGSPPVAAEAPSSSPPVVLHPDEAAEAIRAALLVWATEVRPSLGSNGCALSSGTSCEDCVLLARIEIDVDTTATPLQIVGEPRIDESDRPYLLSTRVLQELWGLSLGTGVTTIIHQPVEASPPDVGVTVHADLDGLDADDHPHYLLHDGTRSLSADWNVTAQPAAPTHRIRRVADGTAVGDVVTFDQAVKFADVVDDTQSDLIGTYRDPRVKGLRGRVVSTNAPSEDDVLRWDPSAGTAGEWVPKAISTPTVVLPDITETDLTRILMTSWDHRGSSDLLVDLDGRPTLALVVLFGMDVVGDMLVKVEEGSLDRKSFRVFVEHRSGVESTMTRLRVQPEAIMPVTTSTLAPSANKVKATTDPSDTFGAAFLLDPAEWKVLMDGTGVSPGFEVELRCDFIRDRHDRAVDGEHLRGALPTGDRPFKARHGIQGGTFASWGVYGDTLINPNIEGPDILISLPGIDEARANTIIGLRPFASFGEFREKLRGLANTEAEIPESTVRKLRSRLRFDA